MAEEKPSTWARFVRWFEKWDDKADRWVRRHLRRGWGYRITNVFLGVMAAGMIAIFLLIVYVALVLERFSLDTNTFLSIILADIPVGIVLWFALERRESKRRRLLDASEIVQSPIKYTHLEIHYCDEYEDGIIPNVRYYVVNKLSKIAYFVDDEVQALVEARFIRRFPKHRDLAELTRYFDNNHITHASSLPQGDDLFRTDPFREGVV